MKKRYLKRWVEYLIVTVQLILFMIMGAESDNLKVFIFSKIIALILFYLNSLILLKYSRNINIKD